MMERVFLLGGHDLEMQEIKRLLISRGEHFADVGLNWSNVRLSFITEEANLGYWEFELQEDSPLPKQYTRIDHHNGYNNRIVSIFQVAEILGASPERHLQLVSVEDFGYIPIIEH